MNVNYQIDPFFKWVCLILFAVMIATCFASCTSTKKINEAINTWQVTHPCNNDTVIVTHNKIDTTVQYDTTNTTSTDTLLIPGKVNTITIRKTVTIHDTVHHTISTRDIRRENFLQQRLDSLGGRFEISKEQIKTERKRGNKWFWIAMGLIGLHVLFIYLKIRKI